MKVTLKNVRLSFPHLFEPSAFNPGDTAKYKAAFLIEKNSQNHKNILEAIKSVATEKWGAKAESILKSIEGNPNKYCFQDGDKKDYDGYKGMMVIAANNSARPLVINDDRTPLTQADGRPYAGCYVNASIELFTYNNSGNGISASLRGVQFSKDGPAFTGGQPADVDEFEDLSADGDEFANL